MSNFAARAQSNSKTGRYSFKIASAIGRIRVLTVNHQPLEQEEFLRLLLKSEREILRYVMAIVPRVADAQEIVQDTAVALWKHVDQYDPSRPFVPWACRFAANHAKEFLRKRGRWYGFLEEEVAALLLERREQLAPQLDQRMEPLRDCVRELPEHNRRLIEKYYFDQKTVEEISSEVNRSVDALYKSLQRVRGILMQCVDSKMVEAGA
ncbi:MAG: sigma-70 family RNA polymerase sigma factor [Planctomycetota bacterium]